MAPPPRPADESNRLQAVRSLPVLNTSAEERFDRITRAAARQLNVPISTITIVDDQREWYKSRFGTDLSAGKRDDSFCGYTILQGKMFVVEDTLKDKRFADNPQVEHQPHVRFYAGVTLHEAKTHLPIGAFCIKDTKPRSLSVEEVGTLMDLARQAEVELNESKK